MFCNQCGTQYKAESAFCSKCGNPKGPVLEGDTAAAPAVTKQGASVTIDLSKAKSFLATKNGKIALGAVGAVVLGAVIFAATGAGGPNFKGALSACGLDETSAGVLLGDNGASLYLDGKGEEDISGLDVSDQNCVLGELNVTDVVRQQMSNTSALMGVQSGDWDSIHAQWTYHPNNGFELSLERK